MTANNNPFNYSHSKHIRKYSPEKQKRYSAYKPTLRLEYDRKCIYCRFPDTVKGKDAFGVDHYRPKSLFPELETDYANLFYCCNTCNRLKGNKWSATIFLPNPDDHVMIEHIRFKRDVVDPISNIGKYACEVLQLNHPDVVRTRGMLLTSLESLERDMGELEKLHKTIQKEFNKGNISENERDADLLSVQRDLEKIREAIRAISGQD